MGENKREYVVTATAMYADGRDVYEGDSVFLDAERGEELAQRGLVVAKGDADARRKAEAKAGDADSEAQRKAAEDARAAEAVKRRAIDEVQREQKLPVGSKPSQQQPKR